MRLKLIALAALIITTQACATLQQLSRGVRPIQFEAAEDRDTQLRFFAPSVDAPLGGAVVRLWTTVSNPNPIGVTLSTLRATLLLEGEHAAEGDFPLGLPLQAGQATTIPLDLRISFSDVPDVVSTLRNVSATRTIDYRVDGTIGVEIARIGTPTFGPMTLFSGELRAPALAGTLSRF